MRSVMTLFVLFASLMLVIPTAAAAVINDGGKETEIPAVTVSDNTESESEALQKAGPGQEKEQTALFSDFLILDRSSGRTETVSAID